MVTVAAASPTVAAVSPTLTNRAKPCLPNASDADGKNWDRPTGFRCRPGATIIKPDARPHVV